MYLFDNAAASAALLLAFSPMTPVFAAVAAPVTSASKGRWDMFLAFKVPAGCEPRFNECLSHYGIKILGKIVCMSYLYRMCEDKGPQIDEKKEEWLSRPTGGIWTVVKDIMNSDNHICQEAFASCVMKDGEAKSRVEKVFDKIKHEPDDKLSYCLDLIKDTCDVETGERDRAKQHQARDPSSAENLEPHSYVCDIQSPEPQSEAVKKYCEDILQNTGRMTESWKDEYPEPEDTNVNTDITETSILRVRQIVTSNDSYDRVIPYPKIPVPFNSEILGPSPIPTVITTTTQTPVASTVFVSF